MEDKEFMNHVISTLTELVKRHDQLQAEQKEIRSDIKQVQIDVKRIDRKVDNVLKYVEHIDTDLQKHKKAEIM